MSWESVALVLESGVVIVGVPLVALYYKERLKNVAREVTDRALADYGHEHDKRIESIRAEHARVSEQFSLYERERHRAYARVFRLYRIAADLHSGLLDMYSIPDFANFAEYDLTDYLKRRKVPEPLAHPARDAFQAGKDLRALFVAEMVQIDGRMRLNEANVAYHRARNAEALEALYLSDAVAGRLDAVRRAIAAYYVEIRRNLNNPSDVAIERNDLMQAELQTLYATMRDELRK